MNGTAQRLAPDALARMPAFAAAVGRAFVGLCERGARATVESRYGARR
jgi:hypothetical protein